MINRASKKGIPKYEEALDVYFAQMDFRDMPVFRSRKKVWMWILLRWILVICRFLLCICRAGVIFLWKLYQKRLKFWMRSLLRWIFVICRIVLCMCWAGLVFLWKKLWKEIYEYFQSMTNDVKENLESSNNRGTMRRNSDEGSQSKFPKKQETSSLANCFTPTKSDDKVPVICLFNIWKHCKLEDLCPDMHYYLPYRWQIYRGTNWEDVPNMEKVEKCYCDPKVDRVPLIDFLTMRSGRLHVRRLSTVSSVVKPSEYVLTTEWLWYWKDERGTWTQYGHSDKNKVKVTVSPSDLEKVYLACPTSVIPFVADEHLYELNFRVMKQKNTRYTTERDVRRRPKFLSFEDVKLLKGSTKSGASKSFLKSGISPMNTDVYPKTWDLESLPEIGCKKVLVSHTSVEFSEIVSRFSKTVSGHKVKTMWRLQNPTLWQVFQWQKKLMKKVNGGQDVKEIRLFHGTEREHINAICNQNFDWRICGRHGTSYGKGSYFARDASYSHNYSTMSSGTRPMFVARVLVGDYVAGDPQMKRPPLRPGSTTRYYDSCVDNTISPSIFVVFEKHQIYPEYLLEYE